MLSPLRSSKGLVIGESVMRENSMKYDEDKLSLSKSKKQRKNSQPNNAKVPEPVNTRIPESINTRFPEEETSSRSQLRHMLIIQILKGKNLFVPQKGIGNPYIKIKVPSRKGKPRIKNTKAKRGQQSPTWAEELFTFINPKFPIHCLCMSSNKTKKIKENDIIEDPEDDIVGQFLIQKEDIRLDQKVSLWYPLVSPYPDYKGKVLVELLLTIN